MEDNKNEMSITEAIERCDIMLNAISINGAEKGFANDDNGFPDCVVMKSLIRRCKWALKRQIPKKPILKNGERGSFVDYEDGHGEYKVTKWQDWVCPICGWFVGQRYNRSQNHSHDQRKCNYCNECGQKLDWAEESEG